jgi:hypothetical protein
MSRKNVEILRRLIDAFYRRDNEAALALLDPEIEFHSALVEKKTYHGYAGLGEYRQDLVPPGASGAARTTAGPAR